MRLRAIRARRVLSLANCVLDALDEPVTVLVGPNGAGKTNIFRAVALLADGLRHYAQRPHTDEGWLIALENSTRGYETDTEPAIIEADLVLTRPEERATIEAYLTAAVLRIEEIARVLQLAPDGQGHLWRQAPTVIAAVQTALRDGGAAESLMQGTLGLEYRHGYQPILYYRFSVNDHEITWKLSPQDGLWVGGPPASGSWATISLAAQWVETWPADVRAATVRWAADPALHTLPAWPWNWHAIARPSLDSTPKPALLIDMLSRPSDVVSRLPPLDRLWRRLGLQSTQGWSGLQLWADLFAARLVLSENPRGRPREQYELEDWDRATASRAGDDLGAYLAALKNGPWEHRERYYQIQAVFHRLSGGNQLDVETRITRRRAVEAATASPRDTVVDVQIRHRTKGLPFDCALSQAGAGESELAYLSTVLRAPAADVLLLDEPGAHLHSYALRRLADYLEEQAQAGTEGPQTLLITHTPFLVPTNNLRALRRVFRAGTDGTQVSRPGPRPATHTEQKRAITSQDLWSRSSAAVNLLFYNAVLLVDGWTEVGALTQWYESTYDRTLEDDNLAIFAIDGKPNLGMYMRTLSEFTVPWAALVDGDALKPKARDGTNVWLALVEAGRLSLDDARAMQRRPFADQQAALEQHRVYTCGDTFDDTFETLPEVIPWLSKVPPTHTGKVRRGYWVASQIACPAAIRPALEGLRALTATP